MTYQRTNRHTSLVTTDARVSTGSRRSAIVDAAEALILRDGIDGVRAQRLADQAGISIATPYYYFESLDAAVEAVQARASERLATARAAAVQTAGDDPLDQLRALLTSDFAGPRARRSSRRRPTRTSTATASGIRTTVR